MKKKLPLIFYLFLHSKVFHKFGYTANRKEVLSYMFEWRIPKCLRPLILEEMFILDLCKRVDRNSIEIKKTDFSEDDCNKYSEELGIF